MDKKVFAAMVTETLDAGMICPGRMANILHYALQVSALPGEMVEFGCHVGRTSALIAALLERPVWLYDSFEGLPSRTEQDIGTMLHFDRGAFAVSQQEVLDWFAKFNLPAPVVYKAWFNAIPEDKLPRKISFAHLDGDMYESIRDSLRLVYPRLLRGGVCIIDDYGWVGCVGPKRAVDEFMANKPERVSLLRISNPGASHAVIVKI